MKLFQPAQYKWKQENMTKFAECKTRIVVSSNTNL